MTYDEIVAEIKTWKRDTRIKLLTDIYIINLELHDTDINHEKIARNKRRETRRKQLEEVEANSSAIAKTLKVGDIVKMRGTNDEGIRLVLEVKDTYIVCRQMHLMMGWRRTGVMGLRTVDRITTHMLNKVSRIIDEREYSIQL